MKGEKKNNSWLIRSILLLGFIILLLIALAVYKETYRKKQVQAEIEKLQQEAARIKRENTELQNKLAYLESPDYKEKEARDKLNLQAEEENVVVIKPNIVRKEEEKEAEETFPPQIQSSANPLSTNPHKWWDYFFKY